jgi:diaminopimelate epimerase
LRLTKHHGSGNDFLILLTDGDRVDPDGGPISGAEVRAICDRHRGIGADGLIVGRLGSDDADLQMLLTNADGSPAEMSGNGIRCLVQAATAARMVPVGTVLVDTAGGRRRVDFSDLGDGLGYAEVDMGPVSLGRDLDLERPPVSFAGTGVALRACAVDVGNPHIVILVGESAFDVAEVGPLIDHAVTGGANVEFIRPETSVTEDGGVCITIEVWERGVGLTEACGTGACAAAAAARSWGLTQDNVDVKSGGGVLKVRLSKTGATLSGPTRTIATVTVDRRELSALALELTGEVAVAL